MLLPWLLIPTSADARRPSVVGRRRRIKGLVNLAGRIGKVSSILAGRNYWAMAIARARPVPVPVAVAVAAVRALIEFKVKVAATRRGRESSDG